MSKIVHNNVELELNLFDADVLDRYETLLKRVKDEVQEKDQYVGLTGSQAIKLQCGHVNRFFDDLFGTGTSDRLFKGKNDLRDHLAVFAQVADMQNQGKEELNGIMDKYMPERLNREQRRNQQNKKAGKGRNKQFVQYK